MKFARYVQKTVIFQYFFLSPHKGIFRHVRKLNDTKAFKVIKVIKSMQKTVIFNSFSYISIT